MNNEFMDRLRGVLKSTRFLIFAGLLFISFILISVFPRYFGGSVSYSRIDQIIGNAIGFEENLAPVIPPLDTALYDKKINELANNPPAPVVPDVPKFNTETGEPLPPQPMPPPPVYTWPVKTIYPNAGAILPFNRIIAYYGNLYSTKMGALGQYPPDEMLSRLSIELKKWEVADPATPPIPALHYIAVVAQESAGVDGKYRARMPDSEIDKVIALAARINAIVFLDIQVGFSTVEAELPRLEKYFKLPNVHLGIDPEFSMKGSIRPGKVVGTLDAADINFASNFLGRVVKENNLTPKVLVIHRYTQKMVTNYKQIKILPEVQVVMHMDGWGGAAKKRNTYQHFIFKEPVLFAGFKLFYKNDVLEKGTVLMTPADLLKLQPIPIYIQYQ